MILGKLLLSVIIYSRYNKTPFKILLIWPGYLKIIILNVSLLNNIIISIK